MSKPTRRKGRSLLLAATSAVTLVLSGCDELTTSGNLMAPNCDLAPNYCNPVDASVPDLSPPADLSNADQSNHD